ncbi:hypothetical protein REPUB_Repub08aG0070900 [Reevesia pubescens]
MEEAVKLFDKMPARNVISWNTMISAYNYNSLFEDSWLWFRKMWLSDFEPDEITYRSVRSACVAMQSTSFGNCENVVCWNTIISAAVKNEENWVALDLFVQMRKQFLMPNSFTFSSVLTACAALKDLEIGKEVHGWIVKCGAVDVFVRTSLIELYVKCGDMDEAVKTFSWMPTQNVVSWTAIISGFVQ